MAKIFGLGFSRKKRLNSPASAAALALDSVVWCGCRVFNPAYPHSCPRQRPDRRLGSGPGTLRTASPWSSNLDVHPGEPFFHRLFRSPCGRLHRRVGRRLFSVGLHYHATRPARNGLGPGQVGYVHDCVVERRVNVSDSPLSFWHLIPPSAPLAPRLARLPRLPLRPPAEPPVGAAPRPARRRCIESPLPQPRPRDSSARSCACPGP